MKKVMLLGCFVLFICISIHPQSVNVKKADDIIKLLRMTGSLKIGEMMGTVVINQMMSVVKMTNQTIPDSVIEIIRQEVNQLISEEVEKEDGLLSILIPIYDKYYTHKDIKELIKFYNTPLGQKLIKTLPAVTQESMLAGQKWGAALGPEITDRIKRRLKDYGVDISEI